MSLIFEAAATRWRQVRADYEDLLTARYLAAEEACRGHLLNRRGLAADVDAFSLFSGTGARAYAYASDELTDWWREHPRLTFADYERQMVAAEETEYEAVF